MKTIVARFTEMKEAPGDIFTDLEGEEVNVNKVDAALRSVGVSLKDSTGQFRDLDDVFMELAERWDSLDTMQQRYVATTAAGSRQQSRFIAMMSNYDRTMELVSAATGSAGASQLQYEKTLDSLETKLTKLKNAWTTFTQTLLDSTLVKAGIDILTLLLETINKISGALDGLADGTGAIASLGMAILAFKDGKSLLNKGLDSILSSFLGKVSVTAEIAGETAALKFQKGVEKGNAATKGTSIFTGAGTAAQEKGFKGGLKAWFGQVGDNISNKWNNAKYYGQYDDFLSNQKMVGEEILNARNSGNIEDIQKLGKSYNLSGKELDKFTNAVRNGGPELDKYTNKIAKNKAGITDQAKASGKSIGQMAAVAAAIVVVTNAIKLVDNAIKTSSEKIAEISTALEEINSKITENQEILDNYQNTKNTYDDMVDSLDELREGTAEWNQNLIKVNSQTQEIISKYPELIKYVKEVNGAQIMSAEGWAAYQDNVTETLQKQYGIQSGLNNQLAQNQLIKNLEGMTYNDNDTIKTTTITSEEQSQIKTGTTIGGVAGGAAGVVGGGVAGAATAGALAGSVVPGLGNAVGFIVGAIVGAVGAAIGAGIGAGIGSIGTGSGVDPRDAIKLGTLAGDEGFVAENATAEQIDAFITKAKSAGIALGELEDVIREDGAAFDEWVQRNVQAELQKESQRDALISNTIAQSDKLMNSDVLSYIKDTVDVSFDDYDERFATALEEAKDLGEDQLKTQYGTLMNLTADEIEAKLESKELSEETMQQAIAANKVAEDLSTTMEGLITVFEDLKEKASETNDKGERTEDAKLATAIMHAVSNDGKSMSQFDIAMFDQLLGSTGTGYQTVTGLSTAYQEGDITDEQLTEYLNGILYEVGTSLEELGISAKDFMSNLTIADNLAIDLIKTYGQDSVDQVNEILGENNILGTSGSGYSIGAQDTIAKAFSRGETESEDNTIKSIFSNLGKQVTEETVDQYNNLLENLDVTDSSSIEDTMKALEDLGFDTKNFADELKNATNATRELTNEQRQSKVTTAENAYDVLNEKTDTTFTGEEKDILVSAGIDDDDFVQLGDKFIYLGGTVNDLRTAVEKNTKAQLGEDYESDFSFNAAEKIIEPETLEQVDRLQERIVYYSDNQERNKHMTSYTHTSGASYSTNASRGEDKKFDGIFIQGTNQYGVQSGESMMISREVLEKYNREHGTNWKTNDEAENFDEYIDDNKLLSWVKETYGTEDVIYNDPELKESLIQPMKDFLLATGEYTEDMLKNMNYDELRSKYDALTTDDGDYTPEKIEARRKEQDASYFATQAYSDHTSLMGDISEEVGLGDKADQDYINNMTDGLKAYAKTLGISNKTLDTYITKLQDTDEGVRAVAAAELNAQLKAAKTKQAIKNNADALKEYNTQLENSPKDSEEYSKALDGIANSMNDIMDTDVDYSFFEDKDNLDLYKDAVNGVEGAWEELKKKMQAESIGNSDFLANSLGLSSESVDIISEKTDLIKTAFNNLSYDANGKVNLTPLYKALTTAGIKAKEATKFLKGMGFSYTITTEKKPLTGAGFISPWSTDAGEVELITGYTLNDNGGGDFSANVGDGPSGGGGGGKSSSPQKNTKKAWHYNRDIKTEKRQNKIADIEHKIAMEQTKQIPNLETLNKLHKQKLDLLEKEKKQQKSNYNAAIKEEKRLWKQGKKKGYNKLLNRDGTVNLKAYNSKKWKNEKAKEKFDEWESNLEDTREYKQSSKEAWQEYELQVAELKNARSEYTKLTNLQEGYEASQERLNRLQSDYNKLLKDGASSVKDLVGNLTKQNKELKKQKANQTAVAKAAEAEVKKYLEEDKKKGISGINKYIKKTDFSTGEVIIDYAKLNKAISKGNISKEDADELINQYKDLVEQAGEANTNLQDIDNSIQELEDTAFDSVLDLQSQVRDAIIQQRQEEIDSLSEIDSSINETNSKILSEVRDSIQEQRQARQNEDKEEELADKQTRLAYLRQYSGTGNAAEIAKLEDEIAKGEESYTDTLIDQKISELEKQNNQAAEQRQRQIKIMQEQLEVDQQNGKITNETLAAINEGTWLQILRQTNGYDNMTPEEKKQFDEQAKNLMAQKAFYDTLDGDITTENGSNITVGQAYGSTNEKVTGMETTETGNIEVETIKTDKKRGINTVNTYTHGVNKDGTIKDTGTLKDTYHTLDGKNHQAVGDFVKLTKDVYDKHYKKGVYGWNGHKNVFKIASIDNKGNVKLQYTSGREDKTIEVNATDIQEKLVKAQNQEDLSYTKDNNMFYKFEEGISLMRKGTAKGAKFENIKKEDQRYKDIIGKKLLYIGQDKEKRLKFKRPDKDVIWKTQNPENKVTKIKQFKTGGLADFTGPAWLDGTKTKPEIILNQKDTENFIQLRNILSDVMKGVPSKSNQNNGDSYAEIHINVEKMTSDYDVDQVAKRVKKILNEDGRYRTVNQINRLR